MKWSQSVGTDRLGHRPATQDRLPDIGHEQRMQQIVIDGVRARDPLQSEPRGGADDRRMVGLALAVDRPVVAPEPIRERLDHQEERFEHRHLPSPLGIQVIVRFGAAGVNRSRGRG